MASAAEEESQMLAGAVAYAFPTESFNERAQSLLERLDLRRADSDEEREAIFRLRYNCYLWEEAILPNPEKRFTDQYDEMCNTWLFGLYLDQKLVSSMRISAATQEFPDMPSMSAFAPELQRELDAGKIIVEPSRFVVDRAASRDHRHLAYLTARMGWMAAEYFTADIVLSTARREHQAFYKRVFGYEVVTEPRPYLGLIKPLGLMFLDYPANRDWVNRRYPFFRSTYFERRMLFERLQATKRPAEGRPDLRIVADKEPVRIAG
jgi:N-acyl-L-homoserine lactone synthetase